MFKQARDSTFVPKCKNLIITTNCASYYFLDVDAGSVTFFLWRNQLRLPLVKFVLLNFQIVLDNLDFSTSLSLIDYPWFSSIMATGVDCRHIDRLLALRDT